MTVGTAQDIAHAFASTSAVVQALTGDVERVTKALAAMANASKNSVSGLSSNFGDTKAQLKDMVTISSTMQQAFGGLGAGAQSLAQQFIQASTNSEGFLITLSAITGDAQGARAELEKFDKLAIKVPFDINQVRQAGVQMKQFGLETDKWLPRGAAMAAMMGKTLPQASHALEQALNGNSRWIKHISQQYGITTEQLVSYGALVDSKGKIMTKGFGALAAFQEALFRSTEKFQGGLEAGAETLGVKLSNMGDQFLRVFNAIGEQIGPEVKVWVDRVYDLAVAINNLPGPIKKIIGEATLAAAVFGTFISGFATISIVLAASLQSYTLLAEKWGQVAAATDLDTIALNINTAAKARNAAVPGPTAVASGVSGATAVGAQAAANATAATGVANAGTKIAKSMSIQQMAAVGLGWGLKIATGAFIAYTVANLIALPIVALTDIAIENNNKRLKEQADNLLTGANALRVYKDQVGEFSGALGDIPIDKLAAAGVTSQQIVDAAVVGYGSILKNTEKARKELEDSLKYGGSVSAVRRPFIEEELAKLKKEEDQIRSHISNMLKAASSAPIAANDAKISAQEDEYRVLTQMHVKYLEDVASGDIESARQKYDFLKDYIGKIRKLAENPAFKLKHKTEIADAEMEAHVARNKAEKEYLRDTLDGLKERRSAGDISTKGEIASLEYLQDRYKNHAVDQKKVSKELAEARKKDIEETAAAEAALTQSRMQANESDKALLKKGLADEGTNQKDTVAKIRAIDEATAAYERQNMVLAMNKELQGAGGDASGEGAREAIRLKYAAEEIKLENDIQSRREDTDRLDKEATARSIDLENQMAAVRKSALDTELSGFQYRLARGEDVSAQILDRIAKIHAEEQAILDRDKASALVTAEDPNKIAIIKADAFAKQAAETQRYNQTVQAYQDSEAQRTADLGLQKISLAKQEFDERKRILDLEEASGKQVGFRQLALARERQQALIEEVRLQEQKDTAGKTGEALLLAQKTAQMAITRVTRETQVEVDAINAKYNKGLTTLDAALSKLQAIEAAIKSDEDQAKAEEEAKSHEGETKEERKSRQESDRWKARNEVDRQRQKTAAAENAAGMDAKNLPGKIDAFRKKLEGRKDQFGDRTYTDEDIKKKVEAAFGVGAGEIQTDDDKKKVKDKLDKASADADAKRKPERSGKSGSGAGSQGTLDQGPKVGAEEKAQVSRDKHTELLSSLVDAVGGIAKAVAAVKPDKGKFDPNSVHVNYKEALKAGVDSISPKPSGFNSKTFAPKGKSVSYHIDQQHSAFDSAANYPGENYT
jgi:hypothetical protein